MNLRLLQQLWNILHLRRAKLNSECGQDVPEYAILLGVIALGTLLVLSLLGTQLNNLFLTLNNVIISAP